MLLDAPGRLQSWLVTRRRAVLVVFGVALVLAAIGATRIAPVQDVTRLVQGEDAQGFADAVRTLRDFGTLDTLLIDVSRSGATPAQLEALADAMVATLQASGDFESLLFRIPPDEQRRLMGVLLPRRFYLMEPPDDLGPGMQAAARDLMMPIGAEGLVTRDPLGQRDELLPRLQAAAPRMRLDAAAGTLLSADGQHALIVAEPRLRALDIAGGEAMLAAIQAAAPEGATVEVLGAHVFAAASARSIKRDVWVTVAATMALVVLLFGLSFRSVGPVVAVSLPVLVGGLVATGVIGWLGVPLHGITFGFGAIMIGIGVDYGAHLVVHARYRAAEETLTDVLRRVLPSITLGALTTLVAFIALAVSGTGALGEVVLFTGVGILTAFAVSCLILPLWGGLLRPAGTPLPPQRREPGVRRPRLVLALAAIATAALCIGLPATSFDGNVRNLDYQPPETRALEARFVERYDHPRYATLVVARGDTVERALHASDRVANTLARAEARGHIGSYTSLSTLVPSEAAQRATLARYDPESLRRRLEVAAGEAGLNPAVFEPFFTELAAAQAGRVAPLRVEDLAGTPLERLARRTLVEGAGGARVLTVVHMSGTGDKEVPGAVRDALTALGDVQVVSGPALAREAVVGIKDSVVELSVLSLLLVGLVLAVYYRSARLTLYALAPVLLAFLWTWGLMGLVGLPFNIVSVGAFALVAGVGVDYGIFVTDAALRQEELDGRLTRRSILVAAATTLAGFGTLLLAHSPVMWSLGFAVAAGVLASLVAALVVLPAVWAVVGPPTRQRAARAAGRRDIAAWIQLVIVVALAALLALSWLRGDRVAGGAQVAIVLGFDIAWGLWMIARIRR